MKKNALTTVALCAIILFAACGEKEAPPKPNNPLYHTYWKGYFTYYSYLHFPNLEFITDSTVRCHGSVWDPDSYYGGPSCIGSWNDTLKYTFSHGEWKILGHSYDVWNGEETTIRLIEKDSLEINTLVGWKTLSSKPEETK